MSLRSIRGLALAALLVPTAAVAQSAPITSADLMRHIEVLASDRFEGREPGTAGGELTEAYLVSAFHEAGLTPGYRGLWRQDVDLVRRTPVSSGLSWTGQSGSGVVRPEDVVLLGDVAQLQRGDLPVVFAGWGTSAELTGVDVRGALVLILAGQAPAQRDVGRLGDRVEALRAAGAAAVVQVVPVQNWEALRQNFGEGRIGLRQELVATGAINEAALGSLTASGRSIAQLRTPAGLPGFRALIIPVRAQLTAQTRVQAFRTANIVGRIAGSGGGGEALLLLAHWDHLGICRPEGASDRICNGAVDNASGTAILIETARRLAAGLRPVRDIYFLATTAEEIGLLGAEAFAGTPPADTRFVAALNLDTTAMGPGGKPVAIIGRGNYPALETVVDGVSRSLGRGVDADTEANVMIQRQDGWALARRGIPTIMATGSVSDMGVLQAYLAGPYHKPEDDLRRPIALGGAVEDANLHVALLRALSDPNTYPAPTP